MTWHPSQHFLNHVETLWLTQWSFLILFEPCHEIMVLFVLRKLNLQMRMNSHPVGLDVWFLVGPFIYFHTSFVRIATIPEWHNFHIKESQLNILFITYLFSITFLLKRKIKCFKQICVRICQPFTRHCVTFKQHHLNLCDIKTIYFYNLIGCWQRYDVTAKIISSLVKYEKVISSLVKYFTLGDNKTIWL